MIAQHGTCTLFKCLIYLLLYILFQGTENVRQNLHREAGNGNVGHGSMTLHDGTHISWWPAVDKDKSTAKKHMVGFIFVDVLCG